ncbi:hypothetical protein OKW21_005727 [Catalinimonas alkaloidigena]|uniref:hypothetical protein n=1 Tax=Catalinimonas alkaloidigena TaxID=1075417 RepID=UPI0024053353|nr:hypothetical protein [Catalinimonas alkaloidigena]MDF9800464.1 hypothetical protein [Catalinimonas alkaloidigena]
MVRIYFTWLLGFFLVALSAHAQEKRGKVSAIARSGKQEILLRWAPNDPATWRLGNRHGYTIERFTIGKNGSIDSTGQWMRVQLNSSPIKPWSLEDWEKIALDDHYAAIAAQAIYGESFEVSGPSGNMITMVSQVKEERNRFGFALLAADHSPNAAQASGLWLKDTSVNPGEEYLYRICLAHNPSSIPIDTALVTAQAIVPPPLPPPPDVEAQFGDQVASIRWNGFYFNHMYVSYQVEKSIDGIHFMPVNDLPIVNGDRAGREAQQLVLIDSLAQNNKTFYYRVRGITAFAEVGPPSEFVSGQGVISLSDVYPLIDTISVIDNHIAQLQWTFPDSLQNHVVGYKVIRSASLNGSYELLHKNLLKSTKFSFSDPQPLSTSYYRVQAMGPDSTFTTSVPYMIALEDSLPPALPSHFEGEVREDGAVYLHWEPSTSTDVLGYRLFRANDPDEEFVMISSQTIQDTIFTDSVEIATLTEQVYYRLVAVDRRFNVSDYSEILSLKRPDVVPPVPAQLTSVKAQKEGIELRWQASPSEDLVEYVLLRWHANSSGFQILQRFNASDSAYHYLDTSVKAGTEYRYILRSIDDEGLSAAHPSVTITALDIQAQEGISQLNGKADREQRLIFLQWKAPLSQEVSGYRIFRAVDDAPFRYYQFSEAESQFLDRRLTVNHQFRYAIQAIFEDGSESELSQEIVVEY